MIHDSNRPQSSAAIKVMEIICQAVRQVHEEDRWRGKLLLDTGLVQSTS